MSLFIASYLYPIMKGCVTTNLNYSALTSLHVTSYEYRTGVNGKFNVSMHDAIVYQTRYRGSMHNFDISQRDRWPNIICKQKTS